MAQNAVVEKLIHVQKERQFGMSKGTGVLSWFRFKDLKRYRIISLEDNPIRTVMKHFHKKNKSKVTGLHKIA